MKKIISDIVILHNLQCIYTFNGGHKTKQSNLIEDNIVH